MLLQAIIIRIIYPGSKDNDSNKIQETALYRLQTEINVKVRICNDQITCENEKKGNLNRVTPK